MINIDSIKQQSILLNNTKILIIQNLKEIEFAMNEIENNTNSELLNHKMNEISLVSSKISNNFQLSISQLQEFLEKQIIGYQRINIEANKEMIELIKELDSLENPFINEKGMDNNE